MEKHPNSSIDVAQLPHYLALERSAADALQRSDFLSAFKYADRRCRILPLPLPHCFVMRADALWQLGRRKQALDDLDRALSIDPHDLLANRRALNWADDERRQSAASRLIATDKSAASLKAAIAQLKKHGQRAWASTSVNDNEIAGWAAWSDAAEVVAILLEGDNSWKMKLVPEPAHSLSGSSMSACAFRIRRPPATRTQHIILTHNGKLFYSRRIPLIGQPPLPIPPQLSVHEQATHAVTVIVPVYADAAATAACLDSLLASRKVETFRVLVIDDASPETAIRTKIAALASAGEVEVLTNPVNLGFVGSVNRALHQVSSGDVILLNSDTLVPPGFATRLAAIANQRPDIATVTPISNNGEFLSFPVPNTANPLQNLEEVILRDRAANKANAGLTIDLPSGIGFCLYIKRTCLNEIGYLSEEYERGYFEDVDFCLRARARGLRNVAAPSVYVGHLGSRSFGKEKRALVLKNLDALDRNFPEYRSECKKFIDIDPLRPARSALERELPYGSVQTILIICGTDLLTATAQARAQQHVAGGCRPIILSVFDSVARAIDGHPPQSMDLKLDSGPHLDAAARDLRRFNLSHIEVIGQTTVEPIIELAKQLGLPIDLWVVQPDLAGLEPFIAVARTILLPTFEAFHLASQARISNLKMQSIRPKPLFLPSARPNLPKTLAIMTVAPTKAAFDIIRALLDEVSSRGLEYDIVVAGTTLDDTEIMSYPSTFVTGALENEEDLANVLLPYNLSAIFLGFDAPIFGQPKIEAARSSHLPVAYVDWSKANRRKRDLAIPASTDVKMIAKLVADWLASGCVPS